MKSTGTQSPNELQRLALMPGHRDNSPSNYRQVDLPYCKPRYISPFYRNLTCDTISGPTIPGRGTTPNVEIVDHPNGIWHK